MTDRYERLHSAVTNLVAVPRIPYDEILDRDRAWSDVFRILDEDFSSIGDNTPESYDRWSDSRIAQFKAIDITNVDELRKHDDLTVVLVVLNNLQKVHKIIFPTSGNTVKMDYFQHVENIAKRNEPFT